MASGLAGGGGRGAGGGRGDRAEGSGVLTHGPDPIDLHAGRRIRAQRIAAGLTQDQLAGHLGISFQQVQKYERGVNRVSVSMLYRIAGKLGMDPAFVYEGLPAPAKGPPANDTMDDFLRAPGSYPLIGLFPRLSRSRQSALLAVARALLDEEELR